MKKVFVSIKNGLLAEAVVRVLKGSGEFEPYLIAPEIHANGLDVYESTDVDIWLMEVSYNPGTTVKARLDEIRKVRSSNPGCKVVFLCDDNAAPDLARKVTQLKKDHVIDAFFYTSVTGSYLVSSLASL